MLAGRGLCALPAAAPYSWRVAWGGIRQVREIFAAGAVP